MDKARFNNILIKLFSIKVKIFSVLILKQKGDSMFKILIIISTIIGASESKACMEKRKIISLSGASFSESSKLGYGVNCRNSFTIENSGKTFTLMNDLASGGACLFIKEINSPESKVCNLDKPLQAADQHRLVLRDSSGKVVGKISFQNNVMSIHSATGTFNVEKSLPYLNLDFSKMESWKVSAFDKENDQVGSGTIESSGVCTKSFSAGKALETEALDIRNKTFETTDGGCAAGISSKDFKKAANSRPKATFDMDKAGSK